MRVEQWPLTAAATNVLLELPSPDAKRGKGSADAGEAVKLALKELLLRGAYRIEVEERRLRSAKISLMPVEQSELPRSLAGFDDLIRPQTPDEISNVIAKSRKANSGMFERAGQLFLDELAERDLASCRTERLLFGLMKAQRWRRTASGEAWAADARAHLDQLEALPVLDPDDESRVDDAGRALATAGALGVMVPGGIAQLAMLDQLLRRRGDDSTSYAFAPTDGGTPFDPIESAGGLVDSAIGDAIGGVDSVTDAIDSMSSSIDSGVDSGVDSGGGSDAGGGGDGGGGGGDGGGG